MRQEYLSQPLHKKDLDPSPIKQFLSWLNDAVEAEIKEAHAMALATASKEGIPSSRMVIMKEADDRGIQFFTNFESRKAKNLLENPYATVHFWWQKLYRQVTIEGLVEKGSRKESEFHFHQRPRASQISSWASDQDTPIDSRATLYKNYEKFAKEFAEREVPLPPQCGNFLMVPHRFEFWQGQPNRLHDRFIYTKSGDFWEIQRLSP